LLMRSCKRGVISVKRQLGKTLLLFLIVLILGTMVSIAISISQGILITERNLRRSIPPVATIIHDNEAISEYVDRHGTLPTGWEGDVSLDMLSTLGQLPYVRAYDYAIMTWWEFLSRDFSLPMDTASYLATIIQEDVLLANLKSLSLGIEGLEMIRLKGVRYANVMDYVQDVITLPEGRVFTEAEIRNGSHVTLISACFARANDLFVGSSFELENNIYDTSIVAGIIEPSMIFRDDNILISEIITLEVIGLFTPAMTMDLQANSMNIRNHMELNTRIYTPINVAKSPAYLLREYLEREGRIEEFQYWFSYQDIIFALYDSLYLDDFYEAAKELVPDFWLIHDLRFEFAPMSSTLRMMEELARGIMVGAIGASILVIGLLIVLFLRDRRQEIGIYVALGEKKKRVIFQMLFEVLVVSAIAITLSLFIGNVFGEQLSMMILRNELIYSADIRPNLDSGGLNCFNQMGLGVHMTGEDMIASYALSLDVVSVATFYGISLVMIFLSTILPILYLLRFNPKKILL